MAQSPERRRFGRDLPYPTLWKRRDGDEVEYHCHVCGKTLIIASHPLPPGRWIQAMCKWCGKERRFTAEDRT